MAKLYAGYSDKEPNDKRKVGEISAAILKERFLEQYMVCGHVGKTCQILGIVPRTYRHWKYNDEQFKKDFEMAEEIVLQLLEDEAFRRGVIGVEEQVYQGGKAVGTIIRYDTQLLLALLRARAPHKYSAAGAGKPGDPINGSMDIKITHVHTGLQLAGSEDQIMLDKPQATEDIAYQELPKESREDKDLLDKI